MKRNGLRYIRVKSSWAATTIIGFLLGWPGICLPQQKAANVAEHEPSYKYDTEVRLEGILVERRFYGPPGFGETPTKDVLDKVFVLKLTHPIAVEPLPDAKEKNSADLGTHRNIRQVQLFVERSDIPAARKMLGRMLIAAGSLHEANAPGQHTIVTLDVKTISPK